MKKLLCSFVIAAAALNTMSVYAQDGAESINKGVFKAVIAVNDINQPSYNTPKASSTYELENEEGLEKNIAEKEKSQILTRDMLMQKIYELEGKPEVAVSGVIGVSYFGDSSEDAATWAYYNKILYGYGDNQFGKGDYATREQLAAMLFRYVADGKVPNLLLNFDDSEKISEWAADSMRWAVSEGILEADDNNMINPKEAATVYDLNNALKILGLD